MAEALTGEHGGIYGLLSLLDEHQEAIEFDLIERGLRLDQAGTSVLSWRDLLVVVKNLPPSSALAREAEPDSKWQIDQQLLATLIDETRAMHRTLMLAHGAKNVPEVEPVERPGVTPTTEKAIGANDGFDSEADLADWYAGLNLAPAA